jgi:hypothetical protein
LEFKAEWSSGISKEYITFGSSTKTEEYVNPHIAEKERTEAIPLEQLSFRDLYQFPFHQASYGSWVYDANSNFIFQFEFSNKETEEKCINILNGDLTDYKRQDVEFKNGEIFVNGESFILIRGWGNLTGCGAYNLDGDYAAKIQDTLAEYIVEKLNKK